MYAYVYVIWFDKQPEWVRKRESFDRSWKIGKMSRSKNTLDAALHGVKINSSNTTVSAHGSCLVILSFQPSTDLDCSMIPQFA